MIYRTSHRAATIPAHPMTVGLYGLLCLVLMMGVVFSLPAIAQNGVYVQNNIATAEATTDNHEDAIAEDMIVLSQLSRGEQNTIQAQDTQTSDTSTRSERPAITHNKLILNSPIIDEAGILTNNEKTYLENQLRKIYDDKLAQMAVVIVSTTDGMEIFDYALATAQRWGLGDKDTDDGILMLIAINDRNIFIVTGYGVEGVLPDAALKRIIREDITPAFKNGQYAQGISMGIARIDERLRADPDTLARADAASHGDNADIVVFIPFIFTLMFGSALRRSLGRILGSTVGAIGFGAISILLGVNVFVAIFFGFILFFILLLGGLSTSGSRGHYGGYSGGSFGGGSSGGGGFGSGGFGGGGGSFGGGGAGGSW